jgi:hypothetical protein
MFQESFAGTAGWRQDVSHPLGDHQRVVARSISLTRTTHHVQAEHAIALKLIFGEELILNSEQGGFDRTDSARIC